MINLNLSSELDIYEDSDKKRKKKIISNNTHTDSNIIFKSEILNKVNIIR